MEYVNSPSVAVVLIALKDGIVLIRRNKKGDDLYGKLALPGGFQNGATKENIWRTAIRGVFEEIGFLIFEEIGFLIFEENMSLLQTSCTDQHGTNLWFFLYTGASQMDFERFSTIYAEPDPEEVSEIVLTKTYDVDTFPLHRKALKEAFGIIKKKNEYGV